LQLTKTIEDSIVKYGKKMSRVNFPAGEALDIFVQKQKGGGEYPSKTSLLKRVNKKGTCKSALANNITKATLQARLFSKSGGPVVSL